VSKPAFKINRDRVLLVEGPDDAHLFDRLIKDHIDRTDIKVVAVGGTRLFAGAAAQSASDGTGETGEDGIDEGEGAGSAAGEESGAGNGQAIGTGLFLGGDITFSISSGKTVTLPDVSDFLGGGDDPAARGRLIKTGAGTLVVPSISNSYQGDTIVSGGTLLINGSLTPSTANVIVNAGGTLGGGGSINRKVIVDAGGHIAIREDAGLLTISSLVGTAGGFFDFTSGELQVIGGAVDLNNLTLNALLADGFAPTPGQVLFLVDKLSAGAVGGTFLGLPEGAAVNVGAYTAQISYVGGNGNDVVLYNFQPVPEPAPVLAAALAGWAAIRLARRRRV
jgi:autotransporter-associated beta strand protein